MPGAKIGYRRVYTGHDPAPGIRALQQDGEFVLNKRGEITPLIKRTPLRGALAYSFASGADWFEKFWNAEYSQIQGVDYFSFANEWFLNGQSRERVGGFARFYVELMEACHAHGVVCTVGDFSVGTPGLPSIPQEANDIEWLAPMFDAAQRLDMPVDFHTYDLPDPAGGIMPREYTWLRWQPYVKRWPNLRIWGGEAGPEGSGLFRPDAQDRIKTYADVMWSLLNLEAGCWWVICDPIVQQNPEGDWSKDDWTPILPWFFPWAAAR